MVHYLHNNNEELSLGFDIFLNVYIGYVHVKGFVSSAWRCYHWVWPLKATAEYKRCSVYGTFIFSRIEALIRNSLLNWTAPRMITPFSSRSPMDWVLWVWRIRLKRTTLYNMHPKNIPYLTYLLVSRFPQQPECDALGSSSATPIVWSSCRCSHRST